MSDWRNDKTISDDEYWARVRAEQEQDWADQKKALAGMAPVKSGYGEIGDPYTELKDSAELIFKDYLEASKSEGIDVLPFYSMAQALDDEGVEMGLDDGEGIAILKDIFEANGVPVPGDDYEEDPRWSEVYV